MKDVIAPDSIRSKHSDLAAYIECGFCVVRTSSSVAVGIPSSNGIEIIALFEGCDLMECERDMCEWQSEYEMEAYARGGIMLENSCHSNIGLRMRELISLVD